MSKPCDIPCPKCGHENIGRTFHGGGSYLETGLNHRYGVSPINSGRGFVEGSGHTWKASRDMIAHECRCCNYSWATAPMKKQPRGKDVAP